MINIYVMGCLLFFVVSVYYSNYLKQPCSKLDLFLACLIIAFLWPIYFGYIIASAIIAILNKKRYRR